MGHDALATYVLVTGAHGTVRVSMEYEYESIVPSMVHISSLWRRSLGNVGGEKMRTKQVVVVVLIVVVGHVPCASERPDSKLLEISADKVCCVVAWRAARFESPRRSCWEFLVREKCRKRHNLMCM